MNEVAENRLIVLSAEIVDSAGASANSAEAAETPNSSDLPVKLQQHFHPDSVGDGKTSHGG